jgi:hypothetical protein
VLDFIVVRVVFFNGDLDTLLDIVHVAVEVGDVLNVPDGLAGLKGLLLVDYLLDLFDLGAGVLDSRAGLCNI